jgi:hypothetical protein
MTIKLAPDHKGEDAIYNVLIDKHNSVFKEQK